MSSIQSPFHSHVLFPRNLSQHFQTYQAEIRSEGETLLGCEFCREDFIDGSTSIYCCEVCGFYVHTSCARSASLQIQHPRHEHPLKLRQKPDVELPYSYYKCVHGCKYKLSCKKAMKTLQVEKYYCSTLREASDGESRLQFAHEHPLTTVPVTTDVSCGGCKMWISEEEACGCRECNIFLHEACAKAPLEIQHHPFHPEHPLYLSYDSSCEGECHACGSPYDFCPIRYRCEECELVFDLSCVISTMPRDDDDDDDDGERGDISRRPSVIDHPLDQHQLSSYHSKTHTKIECSICRDKILSDDFFGCPDCSFFLHESCAQPHAIQHYLHPEHTLTFTQYSYFIEHRCAICGSQRFSFCYYTCQMCNFLIHRICASATLSDLEKGAATTVQYPFHEHELKLYYTGEKDFCTVCDRKIYRKTMAYRCFSKGCNFKLHKSCLQLSSHLVHPSHSLHALTLCFSPPNEDTVCHRCNTIISDTFAFSCGECNFYLHVVCAQMPTLKHPFHEHRLFYFCGFEMDETAEGRQNNHKCRGCHKSCGIDFFWCAQCDYTLHYECSQFLPTLNSEHHHSCGPLVLRESFIEDERAEYYCDICEQRRDPKKWVYFCETCNYDFVAHVECALSPAKLEVIEEDGFIRREEAIQRHKQEIRVSQEQVYAKAESLRPLMEKVQSMRAEVELQRVELKEREAEHAKWIGMVMIEEDESIGGEEDMDSTNGKLKKLKTILKELNTEQANWLIDFLKTECYLPTAFFPCATSQSEDGTATSTKNDDEGDETATSTENDDEGDKDCYNRYK